MDEIQPYPLPEDQVEITGDASEVQEVNTYPPIATEATPMIMDFTTKTYLPLMFRNLYYDRVSAVSYADAYAHFRHPCFPNYGTGDGCNDCTNYLSQVLYQGKLPIIFGPVSDVRNWWYWCDEWCICDNSNTWAATDWMQDHAIKYYGVRIPVKRILLLLLPMGIS